MLVSSLEAPVRAALNELLEVAVTKPTKLVGRFRTFDAIRGTKASFAR
jgi:hypothetical protein